MAQSDLFDIRSELWQRAFDVAVPYEEYLESGSDRQREKWRDYEARIVLSPTQSELFKSFRRHMNVLVLSGIWCGDCARQGPIVATIGAASPAIDVRFLDNQVLPEVRDELRIHGASRVPVVVTLSEDFFEVGRSGDRTLSVYKRKAENELGPACESGVVPADVDELHIEVAEWVAHFERQQLLLRLSSMLRTRHND